MAEPVLEVRDLKKYFPIRAGILRKTVGYVKALDGIDFSIPEGQVLGMVGESGCGKSTAGRTAIRLIEPTSGQIYFQGHNLLAYTPAQMRNVRRSIQMVFQDPYAALNPRQTVGESIGEALRYHGIIKTEPELKDYIAEVMLKIGLDPEVMTRYPHQFSGGQQQRLCIGRAIAMKPKLLVLDEAVSALDVSVQAQILNLLLDLKNSMGLSYLFISHDLSVVQHIADWVIVLYYGKVMESASVHEIFTHPKHPYTQSLLAAIPPKHPTRRKLR